MVRATLGRGSFSNGFLILQRQSFKKYSIEGRRWFWITDSIIFHFLRIARLFTMCLKQNFASCRGRNTDPKKQGGKQCSCSPFIIISNSQTVSGLLQALNKYLLNTTHQHCDYMTCLHSLLFIGQFYRGSCSVSP